MSTNIFANATVTESLFESTLELCFASHDTMSQDYATRKESPATPSPLAFGSFTNFSNTVDEAYAVAAEPVDGWTLGHQNMRVSEGEYAQIKTLSDSKTATYTAYLKIKHEGGFKAGGTLTLTEYKNTITAHDFSRFTLALALYEDKNTSHGAADGVLAALSTIFGCEFNEPTRRAAYSPAAKGSRVKL